MIEPQLAEKHLRPLMTNHSSLYFMSFSPSGIEPFQNAGLHQKTQRTPRPLLKRSTGDLKNLIRTTERRQKDE
jgi:hypothetical protein